MADLTETLKNLKIMYVKKLEGDLPSLACYLDKDIDFDIAMEIKDIIHKYSGTGGMYGLKKLSQRAGEIEIELNKVRDGIIPLDANAVKNYFQEIINLVKTTIEEEKCPES